MNWSSAEFAPKVSIIVATLNNEKTIGECLRSILEQDYPKELLEIIVVDGGSRDSTFEIVKNYPVKAISMSMNAPQAYNYAINSTESDVVGIVDADAKVEKEWLKKLLPHLKEKNVAAVSGTIETWNSDKVLPKCIGFDLKYRYSRIRGTVSRIATMNLLIKRRIFDDIGGFNEELPSQYDTEFGIRVTKKGYKIVLEREAKCFHYNRPTWREYFKQQLQYGKNTAKLYLKNPNLIKGDYITGFDMNIQPVLIASSFLLAILGFFQKFLWYFSALIFASLLLFYIISAVKLAYLYKDADALCLVPVYIVRAIAWTMGGAITIINFIKSSLKGDL